MRSGWDRWLGALGSLLPRRMRERVFEPACYDLILHTLERGRGARSLPPRLVGVLLHVALVNFPQVLVDDRRPSRLGLILGGSVGVSVVALVSLVVIARAAYGY